MSHDEELEGLRGAAVGIAAVRIWCGLFFLMVAALKLPVWGGTWDFPARLRAFLELAWDRGALPALRPAFNPLLENVQAVAYASGGVEAAIGAALVLGLFTRLASFGAMALCALYWAFTARLGFQMVGITITIGVTAAALWIANAGMFWGLDAVRRRRKLRPLVAPATPSGSGV